MRSREIHARGSRREKGRRGGGEEAFLQRRKRACLSSGGFLRGVGVQMEMTEEGRGSHECRGTWCGGSNLSVRECVLVFDGRVLFVAGGVH